MSWRLLLVKDFNQVKLTYSMVTGSFLQKHIYSDGQKISYFYGKKNHRCVQRGMK
jgi:hypothetical protein